MLKKFSRTTNFILIGIVVGLFVGVSVRQAFGDTDLSGTVRADNLTVNTSRIAGNGLAVDFGNLLVPNGNIGIGTTTPTVKLDVVGDIKTTGSIKSNNLLCIGATCINENQLKALLATGGISPITDPTCDSTHTWDANTSSCVGNSVTKVSFAVNEYVAGGAIPSNQYNLGFWSGTDLTCSLVSGPLPSGVSIVSIGEIANTGHTGCALVGAPSQVGVYKITWKGTGKQYMSDTVSSLSEDLEITVYEPKETYRISPHTLPDATVGKPYYFKFRVQTTGNPDIKYARFREDRGVLVSLGLKMNDITGEITGTPTTAGTYTIDNIDYGISTFDHMSGSISPQLVVKSREQTQAEINANIVSVVNDPAHPWTATTNAQSAANLKAKMLANGWTLNDIMVATKSAGYTWKMGEVAVILYPDTTERGGVLRKEIDKTIATLDWSDSKRHESAVRFRDIMIEKGWTLADVLFGKYSLSGWGNAENEIKAVVDANPLSS